MSKITLVGSNPPTDFLLEVSKGNIPGHAMFRWTASNPAESNRYTFPTAGATMTISSADANDTSAGTGARTVKVDFLDSTYAEFSETLTLNGQTAVSTSSSDCFRVNTMTVLTAGTGKVNAGKVYVGTGTVTSGVPANIFGTIVADEGASSSGFYTVPLGKTLYSQRMVISTSGTKAVSARLAQTVGGVQYIVGTSRIPADSITPIELSNYGPAAATSDLEWVQLSGGGSGALVDVYTVGILVDT